MQEHQPRNPLQPSIADQRRAFSLTTPYERPEAEVPSFGRLLMMAPLEDGDLPPRDRRLKDPDF